MILLLLPCSAGAQFYVTGDDPGSLKWRSMDTDSYRIIYPDGTDSLARVYAGKLEKYKIHPEHKKVAAYVAKVTEGRGAVDIYE